MILGRKRRNSAFCVKTLRRLFLQEFYFTLREYRKDYRYMRKKNLVLLFFSLLSVELLVYI